MELLTMLFYAFVSVLAMVGVYLLSMLLTATIVGIASGLFFRVRWNLEKLSLEEKQKRQAAYLEDSPMAFICLILNFIPTILIVMQIKQYLP